jgi:Helix-hairpin-helix motif.
LISEFGSIAAIAIASEDELQSIPGIGPERARTVIRALTEATRPARHGTESPI